MKSYTGSRRRHGTQQQSASCHFQDSFAKAIQKRKCLPLKNRLVVDAQENLGALTVDPMRLRQILLNLLSNDS